MSQKIVAKPKRTSRKPVNQLSKEQAETLTNEFFHQLQKLEFDPLKELIKLFQNGFTPPAVKASIAMELLSYQYPKKKSVDVTAGGGDKPIQFITLTFSQVVKQAQGAPTLELSNSPELLKENTHEAPNALSQKVVNFSDAAANSN